MIDAGALSKNRIRKLSLAEVDAVSGAGVSTSTLLGVGAAAATVTGVGLAIVGGPILVPAIAASGAVAAGLGLGAAVLALTE